MSFILISISYEQKKNKAIKKTTVLCIMKTTHRNDSL